MISSALYNNMWQLLSPILLFCVVQSINGFKVEKYWNGVAEEGETGTIAVKSNGPIEECIWTHEDGDEYSSEDSDRRSDVQVVIEEKDTLCKLRIKNIDERDHGGLWDVLLIGQCNKETRSGRRRRRKRQVGISPSVTLPQTFQNPSLIKNTNPIVQHAAVVSNVRRGKPGRVKTLRPDKVGVVNQRTTSSRITRGSCDVEEEFYEIEMLVARKNDLEILPGQLEVTGVKDEEVILTARTSSLPDMCLVKYDGDRGDDVVELTGRDKSKCNNRFNGAKVCVEKYESRGDDNIFACHVKIDKMNRDLEGEWYIETEDRISTNIDLVMAERPTKTTITIDRKDYSGDNSGKTIDLKGGTHVVECVVEDGDPEPELELFVGLEPVDADTNSCNSGGRNSVCTEFEFDLDEDDHTGLILSCNAFIEGVPSISTGRNKDTNMASIKLKVDGRGSSSRKTNSDECQPTLTAVKNSDEITVCADRKKAGDEFEFEVEFEAIPKPTSVEWIMQDDVGSSTVVDEGRSRGEYTSYDIEEDRDIDNRYIATMRIKELDRDDLDTDNNHILRVKNDVDEVDFFITISTESRCKESQEPGTAEDGYCEITSDYECKVNRDDDCRCDTARTPLCCDLSSNCRKGECCEKCESSRDRDCNLCDKDDRDCYTLKKSSKASSYDCDTDDRDCFCIGNFCCDNARRCEGKDCCEPCDKGDRDCECEGRTCVIVDDSGGDNTIEEKAKKILLDSCLQLSSTLLDVYTPEGDKRPSSQTEREFKNDLEDFFEAAKCTGYDKDVVDYYEDNRSSRTSNLQRDRNRNRNRGTEEFQNISPAPSNGAVAFQNSRPNKVEAVAQTNQNNKDGLQQIVSLAAQIKEDADKLPTPMDTEPRSS